jgi:hypothetical protein
VKVVQTVGCSTFTHGAKPTTRRVADGERMNPQGKGGAFALRRDDEHHSGDDLENSARHRSQAREAFRFYSAMRAMIRT